MIESRSLNFVNIIKITLSAIILLVCSFEITSVWAKYIMVQKQNTSSQATPYHFSSNYLTNDGSVYDVIKTDDGIEVELYNYEFANAGLVSHQDIVYTVSVSTGWEYEITDINGQKVASNESYNLDVLENNQLNKNKIKLYPTSDQTTLTISVSTVSPFIETLSATFNIESNQVVDYSVSNFEEYVVLRIETNNYVGNINVNWDETKFVPDNTNELMLSWQNSSPSGVIEAQAHSTYELIFFKLTTEEYVDSGAGTTINLGGV